jgi:serine/threonine protein kinase
MIFLHSDSPIILHRDLKSANCLCDESLNIKIADFGLAKMKVNLF